MGKPLRSPALTCVPVGLRDQTGNACQEPLNTPL